MVVALQSASISQLSPQKFAFSAAYSAYLIVRRGPGEGAPIAWTNRGRTMALQFAEFCDLIARQVRGRVPTAQYRPPQNPNGPALIGVSGGRATLIREGRSWRVIFARTGQAVTMSDLSGERLDKFVAGKVGASIAEFLEP
jgi:hypothetical protein